LKATEFNEIAEARIEHCRNTLIIKGEEYSRDGDRLHNFKTAAAIDGETPEMALWGMLKKHVVSVRDMVADTERGIVPSKKMVDEKITDWINYGLLLEGLIMERAMLAKTQAGCANIPPRLVAIDTVAAFDPFEKLPAPGSVTPDMARKVEDLGFHVGSRRAVICDD
jgi:hypothetical protein